MGGSIGIYKLFLTIVNLSLVGSYVFLLVVLVRLMIRRAPRWCSYLLWGVVFLRLVCPVFPETQFSMIPSQLERKVTQTIESVTVGDELLQAEDSAGDAAGEALLNEKEDKETQGKQAGAGTVNGTVEPGQTRTEKESGNFGAVWSGVSGNFVVQPALSYLWFIGAVLLAGYHIFSYWRLKRKVRNAVAAEPGVREIQGGHLSFVMGIFRPVIYLSAGLNENSRRVVLCHEKVHLKRRDYLFKPAALAICCLHWFNPLVWVAFHLMNKDCEMSCDEKVVTLLGEESKKIYSYALLDEATRGERGIRRKGTVCALLSFGEDNVKHRIRHVLKYKKASMWTIICAVLALLVLTAGTCSNPENEVMTEEQNLGKELEKGSYVPEEESTVDTASLEGDEKTDGTMKTEDLDAEERDDLGAYNRQYILEHPDQVLSMGQSAEGKTIAQIDLDGDGRTEEISLEDIGTEPFNEPMEHHILKVGDSSVERYASNFYNDIFAFSPDGERIFIALYEDGPSADPNTAIYKYQDNQLIEAGNFDNDIRESEIEKGIISTTIRNWLIQTDSIRVQYCMNENGDLEMLYQESYEYTSKDWDEWEITLAVELPVHTQPGSEETILLNPNQEIRFLAVHNSWEWALVETADGQQGWIHVVDGMVVDLQMNCTDVFYGLSMAG